MDNFKKTVYDFFPYLSVIIPLGLSCFSDKYLSYGWIVLFINCMVSMLHVIHVVNWFQDTTTLKSLNNDAPYKFAYVTTEINSNRFEIKVYSPFRFSYLLHFITALMLGIILMGLLVFIPYLQQHLNLCNQLSFIIVSYFIFYNLLSTKEIICDEDKIIWKTKFTGITRNTIIYLNKIDEIHLTFKYHGNNTILNSNRLMFQFYASDSGKNIIQTIDKLDEQQQEIIHQLFSKNYPSYFKNYNVKDRRI